MKNLSLFVSAFALCASTSFAAINCGTLPSCDSLGYKDKVAECPSSSEVLKCPFDTTWGKCTRGPSVGDLKYSLNTGNHDGWILCNGQSLDTTKYAALYGIIKSNYGMDGTKFRVPDYRGFFLRALGEASGGDNPLSSFGGTANSSLITPQQEELPKITGSFPNMLILWEDIPYESGGAFTYRFQNPGSTPDTPGAFASKIYKVGEASSASGRTYSFDASKSNNIYSGSHVIPANYAANIFIYAGR